MKLELRPVDKASVPRIREASKAIISKFEALGQFPGARWVQSYVRAVEGGHAALVDPRLGITLDMSGLKSTRLAYLPARAKAAQFIDQPGEVLSSFAAFRSDGKAALVADRVDPGELRIREVEFPGGASAVRYAGPLVFNPTYGPPGSIVATDGNAVVLIKLDGGKGTVTSRKEFGSLRQHLLCSSQDGLIHMVKNESPHAVEVLGVFGDELRSIGTIPGQFFHPSSFLEGRAFVTQYNKNFFEIDHLPEAYDAARAGEAKPPTLAPGELGLKFVDLHERTAPTDISNLQALRFEKLPPIPLEGGRWLTLLRYPPVRRALAIVEGTSRSVRTIELPVRDPRGMDVNEEGTRVLIPGAKGLIEVTLADGSIRELGLVEGLAAYGPEGRFLVGGRGSGGLRLLEVGPAGSLSEVASCPLNPWSFATSLGGRAILASVARGEKHLVAVLGIYGEQIKLLAELETPTGQGCSCSRWRHHPTIRCDDYFEVVGLQEAYERGAGLPGRPMQDLISNTPKLDALIRLIRDNPKRGGPTEVHEKLLAGDLPGEVRRLVNASAGFLHGEVRLGDFAFDEDLLSEGLPGGREGLIFLGSDGGERLFAVERADGRVVAVSRVHPSEESPTGKTLEQLLATPAAEMPIAPSAEGAPAPTASATEQKPVPPPVPAQAPTGGGSTHLTCTEDGASKFWEGRVDGSALTVRWGKIGSEGQSKTKSFATLTAAQAELAKLINEKEGKGYRKG